MEYAVAESLALHQGGHGAFEALPFVDATIHLAEFLFAPARSVGVVLVSRRVAVVVRWRLAKMTDWRSADSRLHVATWICSWCSATASREVVAVRGLSCGEDAREPGMGAASTAVAVFTVALVCTEVPC